MFLAMEIVPHDIYFVRWTPVAFASLSVSLRFSLNEQSGLIDMFPRAV